MSGVQLRKWWSSVSYLPSWGDPLRSFMSGTIGMAAGLIAGSRMPRITWKDIDTAFANQDGNEIGLSAKMLSEKAEERPNPAVSKEDAVSAVLGMLAHELAHFRYSPAKLTDFLNTGVPSNMMATTVANIIEDVYIESAIVQLERTYDWMITAAWDYIFPDEDIAERLEKWDGTSLVELDSVLNVMAAWKRGNYLFEFRSEFEENLYNLVMSVKAMHDLQDRKNLIEKVYRLLMDARMEETGEDLEKMMKEQDEAWEKLSDAIKKLLAAMFLDDNVVGTDGELIETFYVRPGIGRGDAKRTYDEHEYIDFSMVGRIAVGWVKVDQSHGKKLQYPVKWRAFKKMAADRGTVRRVRGHAGMSGKLTHPANLHANGQIFSKAHTAAPNGRTGFEGAPQNIVLADLSGSMSGSVWGHDKQKVHEALEVTQGIMEGLVEGKQRVAVYGHTTDAIGMGTENCIIYVAKEFRDTLDAGTNALYNMHKKGAQNNNADSFAIEAVGKKFVRDGSPMRLWVISDGQPACHLYSGKDGNKMTKDAVDMLRKQGIEVYSFSIDPAAIRANNYIYGTANNFDAQDMDVMRKVMQRFV